MTKAQEAKKDIFQGNDFEVCYVVDGLWDGGYKTTVTVKNTGDAPIENWCLQFPLQEEIGSIWNGVIEKKAGSLYTIKNAGWNQDIAVGKTVSFGFVAKSSFSDYPETFCMKREQTVVEKEAYSVRYVMSAIWPGGFNGSVEIKNESDRCIEDWCLDFTFDAQIDTIWNAEIAGQNSNHYRIQNVSYNQNIQPGATVAFGFSCLDEEKTPEPSDMVLTQQNAGNVGSAVTDGKPDEDGKQPEEAGTEGNETEGTGTEEAGTGDKEAGEEKNGEDGDEEEDGLESELTADMAKEYVSIEFQPGNTFGSVLDDVRFVNDAEGEMDVVWSSSNPAVVSETGKVTRQDEDKKVTITADITWRGEKRQKKFELTVIKICHVDKDKIEDLNVDQLARMNQEDSYYDIKINDFGYVERISGKFSPVKVNSYETALYSLYSIRSAMGITDPFQELCPYDADADETGYLFQIAQVCQGIKTFSNTITISADTEGNVDYFSSTYFPVKGETDTTPALTYEQAVEAVRAQFGEIELLEAEEEYCILNYCGQTDFVWEVACDILKGTEKMEAGTYLLLVGGADGEVKFQSYAQSDASQRVLACQEDMLGEERYFYVTKKSKTEYILKDNRKKIRIFNEKKEKFVRGSKDGWTESQVSAIANMSDIYEFYRDHFGRYSYNNARSMKRGKNIDILLDEYKKNNCTWDYIKKQIYIGYGDGNRTVNRVTLKPQCLSASADIMCHEFTHAVMGKDSTLKYVGIGIAGAIGEAYADMGACFFDGNWEMGENSVKDLPVRDNADPERVHCPKSVGGKYYIDPIFFLTGDTEYEEIKDDGGVHFNCTILTHAVYLMQQYGIPQENLEKIWYKTVRMGYNIRANFYTVYMQFLKACQKCGFPQHMDKIIRAFHAVNITKKNSDKDYSAYYLKVDRKQYSAAYFCDSIGIYGKTVDATKGSSSTAVLEDVDISVLSMDAGEKLNVTSSDEDGLYEVSAGIRDGYHLQYQCDGYLTEEMYLTGVNELVQTEYYCDTIKMIPRERAGTGDARGSVYDALTTKGVGGITLKVRKGLNNVYTDVLQTITTKADGSYVIRGLEAGNYCLEMVCGEDSGYISSYFNIWVLGDTTVGSQNGIISPKLSKDQIRIVLTWGEKPEDLDSHLHFQWSDGSRGYVCYWQNMFEKDNETICALDVDDTTSYGPETITIYSGRTGQYQYYVNNFSLEEDLENSDATVRVYMEGQSYPKYTFHVPGGDGEYWHVFDYNSATQRLDSINELIDEDIYEEWGE